MENFRCPSMRPFVFQKLKQATKAPVAPRQEPRQDSRALPAPRPVGPGANNDWDLKAEFKGSRCCISFNRGVKCNRKLAGEFCTDGKSSFKYVHVCCKRVQNGICGKSHPAVKHT